MVAMGVSEAAAKVGFKAIDANGDGVISHEELAVAAAHYFLNENYNSNYKHLLGEFTESSSTNTAVSKSNNIEGKLSGFQLEKIRKYFNLLDVNRNGIITLEDCLEICNRTASLSFVCMTDEIKQPWIDAWNDFSQGKPQITYNDMVKYVQQICSKDDPIEYMVQQAIPMFKAFDLNNDGKVTFREYNITMQAMGISEESAEVGFKTIDVNGDGVLSYKEYAAARAHYLLDEDYNNRYKHFLGEYIH